VVLFVLFVNAIGAWHVASTQKLMALVAAGISLVMCCSREHAYKG
jgi:hypothetical protein